MSELAPEVPGDGGLERRAVRFGVVSDLHYEEQDGALDALSETLKRIQDHHVDTLIVLGDIIVEGETPEISKQRLREVRDTIEATVDVPVRYVPGNHDVVNLSSDEFCDVLDSEGITYTFELTDGITGIVADTSAPNIPDSRGLLEEATTEFVTDAVDEAENVVLFTHHPVHYYGLSDEGWFGEVPEVAFATDKYRLMDVFEGAENIIAGVNGHTHLSRQETYRDIPFFTVNAFAFERPDFTGVNGSFAVFEASPDYVKRVAYPHGEFAGVDRVEYPGNRVRVALGGTFDPVYDGHRRMFRRAFELGDVTVGLTSDELAEQTRHTEREVKPFAEREARLHEELERLGERYEQAFEIRELADPFGVVTEEEAFTHLIVSPETFTRGEKVNRKRIENGYHPLTLEVVTPVLAEDGERISSTRIRNGEIDGHGNLLDE